MEDLNKYLSSLSITDVPEDKNVLDEFDNVLDKLESLSIKEKVKQKIFDNALVCKKPDNDDYQQKNKLLGTIHMTNSIYRYLKTNKINFKLTTFKKIIIFRCKDVSNGDNHFIIVNFNKFEIQYRKMHQNLIDNHLGIKRKRQEGETQLTCKKMCNNSHDDIKKILLYVA